MYLDHTDTAFVYNFKSYKILQEVRGLYNKQRFPIVTLYDKWGQLPELFFALYAVLNVNIFDSLGQLKFPSYDLPWVACVFLVIFFQTNML